MTSLIICCKHLFLLLIILMTNLLNNNHVVKSELISYSNNSGYNFHEIDDDLASNVKNDVMKSLLPDLFDICTNSFQKYFSAKLGQVFTNDIPETMRTCLNDSRYVMDSVKNSQIWALKMADATSKLQSGLFEGNIADLGQYDECVKVKIDRFSGQHCLVALHIQIQSNTSLPLDVPQDVLDGDLILTSAVCVPSTCDSQTVEMMVNNELEKLNKTPYLKERNIQFKAQVNSRDCHTSETTPLTWVEYVVIAFCLLFIALVIVSTVFDLLMRRRGGNRMTSSGHLILRAFSAWRNSRRLLNTNMTEGSLSCINGARFLCIAWVALGHRYKFICQQPLINLLYLPDALKLWWSMLIVNATLSVDVFFLLGGLLNAYVYMRVPGRSHNIKSTIFDYIHRYLRLTPAYALMVAITATWLYRLGDGALWDRVVGDASEACKENWITNMLYVNNYIASDNYCMMQSWYLAADMQMFWLSPLLLYPLWKWPKFGIIEGFILIIVSIVTPFYVAFVEEIKTPIPVSRNTGRVETEMRTLYLPTHTKTISYIVGIMFGYLIYLIKTHKIKWNLSLTQKTIGWILAVVCMAGSLFGAYPLFQIDHPYNRWESSFYIGFYRLFWSVGIGWFFLACSTGNGGILVCILNCKPLIILGRITYSIYLTHAAVIMYKLGNARVPVFLSHYDQITQFLGEFIITVICAVALTLALESPILVMEKILLKRRRSGVVAPENENNIDLTGNRPTVNVIQTDERNDSNTGLYRAT